MHFFNGSHAPVFYHFNSHFLLPARGRGQASDTSLHTPRSLIPSRDHLYAIATSLQGNVSSLVSTGREGHTLGTSLPTLPHLLGSHDMPVDSNVGGSRLEPIVNYILGIF
jgi:hypothetical protein